MVFTKSANNSMGANHALVVAYQDKKIRNVKTPVEKGKITFFSKR